MKTPYTFSILRYVHDIVTGEFAEQLKKEIEAHNK